MKQKTIYVFLDECILVDKLVENFQKKNLEENFLNNSQRSHIESFKSLKNFCNILEKSMYKIPVKFISFESALEGALKKIKGKEYRKYLDSKKIENFHKYLQRRNAKYLEQKEYVIKIDGIPINIIRKKYEKRYWEIFDRKYRNLSEILSQSVDKDDTDYIKTILIYSQERNGRGIYIFLTNDERIIKNFSTIFNELLRNKIYILDQEGLNRFSEKMEKLPNNEKKLDDYINEILKILSYKYIYKSINKNRRKKRKTSILCQ
ncbi:MAG: hypothetical protein QXQ19_01970 [Candidatus Aenigmatarchaeota archaeon]